MHACGKAVGFSGLPLSMHVYSNSTVMVRIPSPIPINCLDCQSHMGLRMDATIFGHMLVGIRNALHMTVTVPVLLTQEPAHHHFVRQGPFCKSDYQIA